MRALIAGWFSFENCGATAGDLMCRDLLADWLREAGVAFDVAAVAPFEGDLDWREADAASYTHVVFVCGPFVNKWPGDAFLEHFHGCRMIGLNLSMIESLDAWNPFDPLWERDSDRTVRPDMTFAADAPLVPVVGLVLVKPQHEYGDRGRHTEANAMIKSMLEARDVAVVPIDTMIEWNAGGLRTAAQIDSAIARMDAVVTTRLHGTVLALRHGVPPVSVDPIVGGAKIMAQTRRIDWGLAAPIDELTPERLDEMFTDALTAEARAAAKRCADAARAEAAAVKAELIASFDPPE